MEKNLSTALQEMTAYCTINYLKPNPAKTQVCAFHLKNQFACQQLNIKWGNVKLIHSDIPVYLGVNLDCILSFKNHTGNTEAKVHTRNNLLKKLGDSKWSAHPTTVRTVAHALCYSAAEYASPV